MTQDQSRSSDNQQKEALNDQPGPTTYETLLWQKDRQLDVTVETIKRLKIFGMEQYNNCVTGGDMDALYWDGYLRALSHVLEAENE